MFLGRGNFMSTSFSNKHQYLAIDSMRDKPVVFIQPRQSSVIEYLSYYAYNNSLNVRFLSGKVYTYEDVPFEKVIEALTAESAGTWYNENIRNKYDFRLSHVSL